MWQWHDSPGSWGLFWMGLAMLLFWLPLLAAVVWAIRGFASPPDWDGRANAGPPADPREVARDAYARGALGRERFLQIIEDLDRTAAGADTVITGTRDT